MQDSTDRFPNSCDNYRLTISTSKTKVITYYYIIITLNSIYNEVAFNEKLAITKENSAPNIPHSPINTSPLMKSHL